MSYKDYNKFSLRNKLSILLDRLDTAKTAIDNMPSGGDLHEYISDTLTKGYGPATLLNYPYDTLKLSSAATGGSTSTLGNVNRWPEKLTIELISDSYSSMASTFNNMTGCKELIFKSTNGKTYSFANAAYVKQMFYVAGDLEILDISCFDFAGITSKPDRMMDRVGKNASAPTIVYVKDTANQEWLLANGSCPSTWSTANVIVKR